MSSVRSRRPPAYAVPESFETFTSLDLDEVRSRAEDVEARPAEKVAAPLPCARSAWRRVYRDMRRARVATVADLKPETVEHHASRLGYGYFRIRVSNRDRFMPLPA